jgi:hypothetical protein
MDAEPLFSFGVIADLHYMDVPDGMNFDRTRVRRFRRSIEMLKTASTKFSEVNTTFNMLLGDIIDGKAKTHGSELIWLDQVLRHTLQSERLWYAVLG